MSKNQHSRTFQTTKKLNLMPTKITFPFSFAGTKLSPICSPKMYVERTPKLVESRFQWDNQNITLRHGVNAQAAKFLTINAGSVQPISQALTQQ
jgi:hypothetical protein